MLKNRITFCLIVCLCINFLFQSCNESKPHEFSHDEDVNQWIIDNKSKIMNYDRDDIKKYDIEKQRAILSFLPSEKRKEIWKSKVDYILKLDVTKEEKHYFKLLTDKFKYINYKTSTPDSISNYLYNTAIEAKNKFGWNDKYIYNLFFTVDDINSKTKQNNNQYLSRDLSYEQTKITCDCKYDMGCTNWPTQDCKSTDKCDVVKYDCGFFGNDNCTGFCF